MSLTFKATVLFEEQKITSQIPSKLPKESIASLLRNNITERERNYILNKSIPIGEMDRDKFNFRSNLILAG